MKYNHVNLTLPENVSISSKREKQEARIVLGELNNAWENWYAHTLTSVIPSMVPQHNLVSKKTKIETKQRDRNIKKKISAHIAHQLGENATMTLLAEGESLSSYKRKRLSMSFEEGPVKKPISHSPTLDNQTWS